jgi:hypothetical protein
MAFLAQRLVFEKHQTEKATLVENRGGFAFFDPGRGPCAAPQSGYTLSHS